MSPDFRALFDEHADELSFGDGTESVMTFEAFEAAVSAALAPSKAGEVPSDADLYDLAEKFNGDPVPAMREALEIWGCPATPPAPEVGEQQRNAVIEAVTEALGDAYDCLRVWEDWGVGTMGEDYFELVAENGDRVVEIADAAIKAMRPAAPPVPAVVPVAVSERLPDPRPESEGGDCDAEGRCWIHQPHPAGPEAPEWKLARAKYAGPSYGTICWRPASAIPMPQAGEVEG